jgi:hypothetical protein
MPPKDPEPKPKPLTPTPRKQTTDSQWIREERIKEIDAGRDDPPPQPAPSKELQKIEKDKP